jgi:hypothetical protein
VLAQLSTTSTMNKSNARSSSWSPMTHKAGVVDPEPDQLRIGIAG